MIFLMSFGYGLGKMTWRLRFASVIDLTNIVRWLGTIGMTLLIMCSSYILNICTLFSNSPHSC